MARADRLKEELGWPKLVFGVLAAMGASLIAWLAQNYSSASRFIVLCGVGVAVSLVVAIIWTVKLIHRGLDELEREA